MKLKWNFIFFFQKGLQKLILHHGRPFFYFWIFDNTAVCVCVKQIRQDKSQKKSADMWIVKEENEEGGRA